MSSVSPDSLQRLVPLGNLRADVLTQVASLSHLLRLPRSLHETPYPWPQQIIYLLKGELKLGYDSGISKVLVGGSGKALAPLSGGSENPIHVRAITDAELLSLDENGLDILMTWDQLVPVPAIEHPGQEGDGMSSLFDARRLAFGSFSCLPPAHIDSLLACLQRQPVSAGEVIIRQGEAGDYYYLIERGRATVSREVAGASMELAELETGDAFGEEALIANTSRNATVTMRTDGVLLRLGSADFVRLLRQPLLHTIAPEEAGRRVAAGAQWLDVRFPAEYRHDGLPGALNIPLNELRDTLPNLAKDREYIAYCQTGRRSSAAAFLLSQRGFHAGLLAGGLKAGLASISRKECVPA